MAPFQGRLTIAGWVVLPEVAGELLSTPLPGGRVDHEGHFTLPPGRYLPPGVYQLELADGRSGDILVSAVSLNHQAEIQVPFAVLGSLK
jgi:hypothetical protein